MKPSVGGMPGDPGPLALKSGPESNQKRLLHKNMMYRYLEEEERRRLNRTTTTRMITTTMTVANATDRPITADL